MTRKVRFARKDELDLARRVERESIRQQADVDPRGDSSHTPSEDAARDNGTRDPELQAETRIAITYGYTWLMHTTREKVGEALWACWRW